MHGRSRYTTEHPVAGWRHARCAMRDASSRRNTAAEAAAFPRVAGPGWVTAGAVMTAVIGLLAFDDPGAPP